MRCGLVIFALLFSTLLASAAQTVTLAWNASADTNVTGYYLYRGTVSGNYPTKVNVGNVTSCTSTGLVEGATYYFVVTAFDSHLLESLPSNEVSYGVPSNGVAPQPTVTIIPLSTFTNVMLSWTLSPNYFITNTVVLRQKPSETNFTVITNVGMLNVSNVFTSVTNTVTANTGHGTLYKVTLQNGSGSSPSINTATNTAPNAIVNLIISGVQ